MAAVIDFQTGLGVADPSRNGSSTSGPAGRGPAPFRVIEGGQSVVGRRLRRTYLRRRVLAATVLAVVVLCLVQLAGAAVSAFSVDAAPVAPLSGESYRVAPGDTLWGIANRVAPDADPRGVVDQLIALNPGVVSPQGGLRSGEVLLLPRS